MATQTPTERRAREVLAEDLWTWAERQRTDQRSWRWIATKLAELSKGDISVTPQYLSQKWRQRVRLDLETAQPEEELASARKTA